MKEDKNMLAVDDCWNRIGVQGDRSCERLPEQGHCRNCDMHGEAAARMMRRPAPPDYRNAWTAHIAEPEAAEEAPGTAVVVFRVANEWLALPARHAVTVAEAGKLHHLPHRGGNGLDGIINVKGRLYPCMALAALLGLQPESAAGRQDADSRHGTPRILVIELAGITFALPVQEVLGIHRYHEHDLQAAPATLSREARLFVRGVLQLGNIAAGCLDPRLLGEQLAGALK